MTSYCVLAAPVNTGGEASLDSGGQSGVQLWLCYLLYPLVCKHSILTVRVMMGMWFLSLMNFLCLLAYRKLDGYEQQRSLQSPTSHFWPQWLYRWVAHVHNNAQWLPLSNNKVMDALVAHIPYFSQSLQWHTLAKSEVVQGPLILTLMMTLMLKLVQLLICQLARK